MHTTTAYTLQESNTSITQKESRGKGIRVKAKATFSHYRFNIRSEYLILLEQSSSRIKDSRGYKIGNRQKDTTLEI